MTYFPYFLISLIFFSHLYSFFFLLEYFPYFFVFLYRSDYFRVLLNCGMSESLSESRPANRYSQNHGNRCAIVEIIVPGLSRIRILYFILNLFYFFINHSYFYFFFFFPSWIHFLFYFKSQLISIFLKIRLLDFYEF